MKTIIAPVDFSDCSTNALEFAAELAKRAKARLIILHTLESSNGEEEAEKKLKSVEADLKKSFGAQLKCEVSLLHGKLISTIKRAIAVQEPDLIVMGTKGATGLKRVFMGSNTVNVLSKTKLPVLVIPEAARFDKFHKKGKGRIVLATDLAILKNESALDLLKEIALLIEQPKVRVVSVRPKDTTLNLVRRMERDRLLSVFSPEIEAERITVFSSSVMDGIEYYLDKNKDTGLVAMIARESEFLVRRHYTREMASHTHLPLLILNDVKK